MFKKLRVAIWLYITRCSSSGRLVDGDERTTDWDDALWVVVYPIAGDGTVSTSQFVDNLEPKDFADIEAFINREAKRYGVTTERSGRGETRRPRPRAATTSACREIRRPHDAVEPACDIGLGG